MPEFRIQTWREQIIHQARRLIGALTGPTPISSSENAGINVTEAEALTIQNDVADAENAAINVTEAEALDVTEYIPSAENAGANVTDAESIDAATASAENAGINVTEAETDITANVGSSENAGINVTETGAITVYGNFPTRRVRVDIYSAAGVKLGSGPLRNILACETDQTLDELGTYSFTIPANDPQVSLLTDGCEVWIYREGEGNIFKGVIETSLWKAGEAATLTISGNSVSKTLVWDNTMMSLKYSLQSASTVLTDLLTGTDFSAGSVDAGLNSITQEYSGVSKWLAAKKLAEYLGVHIREDIINKQVDLGAFGTSSGIQLRSVRKNTKALEDNDTVFPIASITRRRDSTNLINKIQPFGAGEGTNRLDLRYSTRATPYTIQSGTVNGETQYWLEDSASITSYRQRTRVVAWKDIGPQENTQAAHIAAANTLYDAAVDMLERSLAPIDEYTVEVVGIKQYNGITGAPYFQLGETFYVFYRGLDSNGVYLDVNTDLTIMGIHRSFDKDGECKTTVKVSTVDKLVLDDQRALANTISDIKSMQMAHRPFNYREIHGPYRQTVNDTYPMEFAFRYDGNVAYLLLARLEFRIKNLRSNTTGSAAGGATSPTTSSGGSSAPTSSAGGAQTASAGTSHSHTVSGGTAGSAGSHRHQMFSFVGTPTITDAVNAASGNTGAGSSHNHSSATTDATDTSVVGTNHAHTVSGGSGSESGHTHSLGSHIHNITTATFFAKDSSGSNSLYFNGVYSSPNAATQALYTWEQVADHTHALSGITNNSESAHTHTVADHTHTVTISAHTHTVTLTDHTHTLSYGVYEQTASATPGVSISINGVDRTAALGGPWNTDQNIDITTYLLDTAGQQPLRQQHVILLSVAAGKLIDLDVTLRSMVTANSVAAV